MPAASTKTRALRALAGMRTIIENEMLCHGVYVSDEVEDPEKAGQLCGGRHMCAVGSLWVGGGVKVIIDPTWHDAQLPGTESDDRDDFLKHRPGLRLAYEAMNAAAKEWADAHGVYVVDEDMTYLGYMEYLFEVGLPSHVGYDDYRNPAPPEEARSIMLSLIDRAEQIVKAA